MAQPATVEVVEDSTSNEPFEGQLASPCCRGELASKNGSLVCEKCHRAFAVTDNIPELFWPHEKSDEGEDITEIVRAFYEETPFPNYNDHDSLRSLVEKSRKGLYARRLDETIPYNTSVLEVGCGTGQLTNFLGRSCRRVIGADLCLNSLRLGESFRREAGLERVRFMQMNLFRPALRPERFDVVLCNGVLLTTRDPFEGFQHLAGLVKPGGHIVIGLYNTYARLATDVRRQIFRVTRGRAKWIDPVLRQEGLSEDKRRAWYADQYCHPHETKQTFGEVQEWFDKTGFEFVRGVPAMRPEDDGLGGESLFDAQPRGTKLEHFLVQAMQIVAPGQKEGGFFIMIGRKPGNR
ncbi:MAG: methyltransferase domain-containing protein [Candidatus Krumholzibacteria bacterium]